MARSDYIYLAHEDGKPRMGFTVKHELVSWLRQLSQYDLARIRVFRMRDACEGMVAELYVEALLKP